MAAPLPWLQRNFTFDTPVELHATVLERFAGLVPRIEAKVSDQPARALNARIDGAWSIQEHIGHLLDLEDLGRTRLDQLLGGATTLVPADMSNKKTWEAEHNAAPIDALLMALRQERDGLVTRLEELEPADFALAAHHPRLQKPMRIIDLLFFICEHDDHHLAHMSEILRHLR